MSFIRLWNNFVSLQNRAREQETNWKRATEQAQLNMGVRRRTQMEKQAKSWEKMAITQECVDFVSFILMNYYVDSTMKIY